jgi:NAD(P)-dependent dehydrogenase (short-subunit alcohol dehydrogenase family)
MGQRLKDKVVIITGAGMGIGQTMAILFSKEGAKIVIAEINEQAGHETLKKIMEIGGEAIYVLTDISKEENVETMAKETLQKFGRIDVLCNNAGVDDFKTDGPVTEVTEETLDRILGVNLKGVFFCCKHTIPAMIKGGGGSIINLSSVAAIIGRGSHDVYTASKGGILAITRSIATEFAGHQVRCNAICPGPTITPMIGGRLDDPKVAERYMPPIGRFGTPQDIAHCGLYLASNEASWVTGQTFVLDGGVTVAG